MRVLLNDLLNLAQIENNTFKLVPTFFNLAEVVEEAFEILDFSSKQRSISFKLVVEPEEKTFFQYVYGDTSRYKQILVNFLSNAVKFSKSNSEVLVFLRVRDSCVKA